MWRWLFVFTSLLLSTPAQAGRALAVQAIGQERPDGTAAAVEWMLFRYWYGDIDLRRCLDGMVEQINPHDKSVSARTMAQDLKQFSEVANALFSELVGPTDTAVITLAPMLVEPLYGPLLPYQVKMEIEYERPVVALLESGNQTLIVGYEEDPYYGLILVVNDPFPYGQDASLHALVEDEDGKLTLEVSGPVLYRRQAGVNPYLRLGWKAYGPHSYLISYRDFVERLGWTETLLARKI